MCDNINIHSSIHIVSEPFEKTFFFDMNIAGRVSYYMPMVEDIEVYFTDHWGDIITDAHF